jgi:hypothetical protein
VTRKTTFAGDHSWIIGGGAYHTSDKIVQHNGCGTVNVCQNAITVPWKHYTLTQLDLPARLSASMPTMVTSLHLKMYARMTKPNAKCTMVVQVDAMLHFRNLVKCVCIF